MSTAALLRRAAGPLRVARIDEASCIGCTLCLAACPVDAIVGATKRMHTVLPSLCTGCELCIAPCPVDCIGMVPAGRVWSSEDMRAARARHAARERRLAMQRRVPVDPAAPPHAAENDERARRREAVAAALDRARARRAAARQRSS